MVITEDPGLCPAARRRDASFPDMAVLEYEPFKDVQVQEVFCVYSSGSAVIDLTITNAGRVPLVADAVSDPASAAGFPAGRPVRPGDATDTSSRTTNAGPAAQQSVQGPGISRRISGISFLPPAPESYGAYEACSTRGFLFCGQAVEQGARECDGAERRRDSGPAELMCVAEDVRLARGNRPRCGSCGASRMCVNPIEELAGGRPRGARRRPAADVSTTMSPSFAKVPRPELQDRGREARLSRGLQSGPAVHASRRSGRRPTISMCFHAIPSGGGATGTR